MSAEETREFVAQIVSITFDATLVNQAKKNYKGCEVIYKIKLDNGTPKTETKNMHNNTFKYNDGPALKTDLEALKQGDYVLITSKKVGEFVNWTSAKKTEAPVEEAHQASAAPSAEATPVTRGTTPPPTREAVKSNYETPEERALRRAFEEKKQTLIIRQSAIGYAIQFFALDSGNFVPDTDAVLEVARKFESFVNGETSGVQLPE